jgi:hypothetical protein
MSGHAGGTLVVSCSCPRIHTRFCLVHQDVETDRHIYLSEAARLKLNWVGLLKPVSLIVTSTHPSNNLSTPPPPFITYHELNAIPRGWRVEVRWLYMDSTLQDCS